MKKLLLSIFLLFAISFVYSQQQQLYTVREVKEMAVFPGCEKIKSNRLKEVNQCLASQLSGLLNEKLDGIETIMNQHGITKAFAIIQFVISKEGVILGVANTEGSDPILGHAAVNALNMISEEIKPIRPAKLKSGEMVNILYQMPVTYENDNEQMLTDYQFPVDEIVLFTLKSEQVVYEIRLFKNQDIKIYEIKDGKQTFVGKFLSLSEVEKSDPYKSLIEKESLADKTLVSGGKLGDGYYEIYIHNLFQNSKKSKPIFVEIEKVENQKRTLVKTYEKEDDFNRSIYAPLIYRE